MMMYELHVPLVMMANRAIERGPGSGVSKNEIKKDLKVSIDCNAIPWHLIKLIY